MYKDESDQMVAALEKRGVEVEYMVKDKDGDEQFRIPGGPIVPICSSAVVVWLLLQMTAREAIGVGALLAVTVLIFFVRKALWKSARSPT